MLVRELIAKVRDKLQDTDSTYWSDSEFIDLYNECKRYISAERKENPTTIQVITNSNNYVYKVNNVLRYISAKDNKGYVRELYPDDTTGDEVSSAIIVQSYDTIYVNNPIDNEVINLKVISFPNEDNLNDAIRMGDEEAYTYFILSKSYEKDTDMEQFQKAQYFWSMFEGALKSVKKNSSLNFINDLKLTKSYFY